MNFRHHVHHLPTEKFEYSFAAALSFSGLKNQQISISSITPLATIPILLQM